MLRVILNVIIISNSTKEQPSEINQTREAKYNSQ